MDTQEFATRWNVALNAAQSRGKALNLKPLVVRAPANFDLAPHENWLLENKARQLPFTSDSTSSTSSGDSSSGGGTSAKKLAAKLALIRETDYTSPDKIQAAKVQANNAASRVGSGPDFPDALTPTEIAALTVQDKAAKDKVQKSGFGIFGSIFDDVGSALSDLKDNPVTFAGDALSHGADLMSNVTIPVDRAGAFVKNAAINVIADPNLEWWQKIPVFGVLATPAFSAATGNWDDIARYYADLGTGMKEGITGETDTSGSELVRAVLTEIGQPDLLEDSVGYEPGWLTALKRGAKFTTGLAVDIGLNPTSYLGFGAAAEALQAPEAVVKAAQVYDTVAGSKKSGAHEAAIAARGGTKLAERTATRVAKANNVLDNLKASGHLSAPTQDVWSTLERQGEGSRRAAGGLFGNKRMSPTEIESAAATITAQNHDYLDQQALKWATLPWDDAKALTEALSDAGPMPEIAKVILEARVKAQLALIDGTFINPRTGRALHSSSTDTTRILNGVARQAKNKFLAEQDDLLLPEARRLIKEQSTKGSVVLRGRVSGRAGQAGRASETKFAPGLYEKGAKLKNTLTQEKRLTIPGLGEHANWFEPLYRNMINASDFPGRADAMRQQAMSAGADRMTKYARKLKDLRHGVSKDGNKELIRALEAGDTAGGYAVNHLGKPIRSVEGIRQELSQHNRDIFDEEIRLGLRRPESVVEGDGGSVFDPNYFNLDLRSEDKKAVDAFRKGRREEIEARTPMAERKYTWQAAKDQKLNPNPDIFQSQYIRFSKMNSKLNKMHFTGHLALQYGGKAKWTDSQAARMGQKALDPKSQEYIKTLLGDLEHPGLEKGERYFVPIAYADAHKNLKKIMDLYDPYEMKNFTRFVEKAMRQWKYWQTVPKVGAQVRNAISDIATAYWDDIPVDAYARRTMKAWKLRHGEVPDVVVKGLKHTINVPDSTVDDFWHTFADIGTIGSELITPTGGRLRGGTIAQAGHKAKEVTTDWADKREKFLRHAHFDEAFKSELSKRIADAEKAGREFTPGFEKSLVENALYGAQSRVNKFHVDYSNLTPFELKIRRYVPFYTYTRGMLGTILQQAYSNPGRLGALASFQRELPALFGAMPGDNLGGGQWNPVIPQFMRDLNGQQLQDEREPLWFGGNLNPLRIPAETLQGNIFQNAYGRTSPVINVIAQMMTGKDSLGRPVSQNLMDAIQRQMPGAGDNPTEQLRSYAWPQDKSNFLQWVKMFGPDITNVTEGRQLAEIHDSMKGNNAQISDLNQQLFEGGLKIVKTPGKQEWRVSRIDDKGHIIGQPIGRYTSPGQAEQAASSLLPAG